MLIHHLDHMVLTVKDIARSVAFYTEVLGMTHEVFGENRHALKFGKLQKINLHQSDTAAEPKAKTPVEGSADICFIINRPLEEVQAAIQAKNIAIELGPIKRTGAISPLMSIYLRDPDGNLIELSEPLIHPQHFKLLSQDLAHGQYLSSRQEFNGFDACGDNHIPDFAWENAPEGTKSFAITLHDPDAPTGSGWWHWVLIDLPASEKQLRFGQNQSELVLPIGARHIVNDYGFAGFGGACPPKGDIPHRYVFTLWALPIEKLEVTNDASAALVGFLLNHIAIGKTAITTYYAR